MDYTIHRILSGFFLILTATPPVTAFALTPSQVFEQVRDSVVVVRTLHADGTTRKQGSGVMLPSGQVATNCHVVESGASLRVGKQDKFITAELLVSNADKDLCLLAADGLSAKPATIGKSSTLKVGETVYAVGSPRGLELSLSNGIVSQLRGGSPPLIQTTAAMSPGSSGGGLFDGEGQLVGITTFYVEGGQSLNFAVPVEWLAEIKPGRMPAGRGRTSLDWVARAAVLEKNRDWHGLLNLCKQWTAAAPTFSLSWFCLGDAYNRLNRYRDAIAPLREALSLRPDDADAWQSLGFAYENLKSYINAIDAYRQGLRFRAKDADLWIGLAYLYRKLGRQKDAINAYRETLRVRPDDTAAWEGLAFAYYDSGNRQAALEAVRELRRYRPEKAEDLFDLFVPR